jgi:hypothetical protein
MSMGTFLDPTNHYLLLWQLVPQLILVESLVIVGYQAHQIHFLPPPDRWKNLGCQSDGRAYPAHVQFKTPPHMG